MSAGRVIFFDLSDPQSFITVKDFLAEIMSEIDDDPSNEVWLQSIIFVGDLHYVNSVENFRKVSFEEASSLFEEAGFKYIEVNS